MASSINKVIIVGNLGRDPEVRNTASGQKIVNFSVATSDIWKDKAGVKQERTEWHRIVVFSPVLADLAAKYLHKGSKVYIEGSLQTRKWTDQSGQEKYTTEVVVSSYKGELGLLDTRPADAGEGAGSGSAASGSGWEGAGSSDGWDSAPAEPVSAAEFDDEIPF